MNPKLEAALNNVEMSYSEVVFIANDSLKSILDPINDLVKTINAKSTSLSIDSLREYILQLQLKAFELSEIKEKSSLKAELSAALQKEAYAVQFNSMEGSAATKEKLAMAATSQEVIASALYNLVSNLLKTKLDQLHRLVDCLKSILMSRMQETKFMNVGVDNNIPATKRMSLNEDYKNQF